MIFRTADKVVLIAPINLHLSVLIPVNTTGIVTEVGGGGISVRFDGRKNPLFVTENEIMLDTSGIDPERIERRVMTIRRRDPAPYEADADDLRAIAVRELWKEAADGDVGD